MDSLPHLDDMTASVFISLGMEIEELMFAVCLLRLAISADDAKKDKTLTQMTDLQRRRTTLLRKIARHNKGVPIFFPNLYAYLSRYNYGAIIRVKSTRVNLNR